MIAPLAHELISSGAADRWFFLRYGDPRFHLRVRFHGDEPAILGAVQQLAARALEAGLARDAELGTYQREIERYGGADGMLVAERLFHADSDAVVALLDMFEPGERGLEERWQTGVLGSHALLCDLGLDDQAQAAFTRRMHAAFEREFRADARLRNAIAGRVRAELGTVDALLAATADSEHPLTPGIAVLAQRSERISPLAADLADLRAAGSRSAAGRARDVLRAHVAQPAVPLAEQVPGIRHLCAARPGAPGSRGTAGRTAMKTRPANPAGRFTTLAPRRRHSGKSSGVTSPPIS